MCGLFILMPIGTRTLDPKKPSWSKERIDSSMFAAAILATRQQKGSKKTASKRRKPKTFVPIYTQDYKTRFDEKFEAKTSLDIHYLLRKIAVLFR